MLHGVKYSQAYLWGILPVGAAPFLSVQVDAVPFAPPFIDRIFHSGVSVKAWSRSWNLS
jgi:hypothetical protein